MGSWLGGIRRSSSRARSGCIESRGWGTGINLLEHAIQRPGCCQLICRNPLLCAFLCCFMNEHLAGTPVHLSLRSRPRLNPPYRPYSWHRRPLTHEPPHRLEWARVTMLSNQHLVETFHALRPARFTSEILPSDPRHDDGLESRAGLRLIGTAINSPFSTSFQPVPERAFIHAKIRCDAAHALALTHEHLRANQIPLRQFRHKGLPSTKTVPETTSRQCGKVGVP